MDEMIRKTAAIKIADDLFKLHDGKGSKYNEAISDYEYALDNLPVITRKSNLSPTGDLIGSELEMKLRAAHRKVMKWHHLPLDNVVEADVVRDFLSILEENG